MGPGEARSDVTILFAMQCGLTEYFSTKYMATNPACRSYPTPYTTSKTGPKKPTRKVWARSSKVGLCRSLIVALTRRLGVIVTIVKILINT